MSESLQGATVQGAAKLERKLNGLEKKIAKKIVRKALRKGAKPIQQKAKELVPKRTGTLRKSIRIRTAKRNRKGSYAILVGTGQKDNMYAGKTFYGAFVEFGHYAGKRKGGKKSRQSANGRTQIPAQPFLKPAHEDQKQAATNVIMSELAKGIEEVAKK